MSSNAKRISCWWAAAAMLIVGLYSAMGLLEAGSLYEGERALQSLRFWGSITVFSFITSVLFSLYASRLKKDTLQQ